MEDAIILEERGRKQNNKYNGEEICFRALVDTERLPQHLIGAPLCSAVLRVLFNLLLRRTTENLRPFDLIRFCFQANSLDKPTSTCLMPVSDVTIEKVLAIVMKVLQSHEEIDLSSGFSVDVITIRRDYGGGRTNRRVINVEVDRLRKKCIFPIPYDNEGLCCAKAIVYGLAYVNKDRTALNAVRDFRRPALMNRAKTLHEAAQVPLGPCTFTEVALFEQHLNVQIAVFSTDALNKVLRFFINLCFIKIYISVFNLKQKYVFSFFSSWPTKDPNASIPRQGNSTPASTFGCTTTIMM